MSDAIAAGAAVVSALASVVAIFAAFRSAGAAERSAKHAADVERRALVRDTLTAAASIMRDAARAKAIAEALPSRYKAFHAIDGSGGGSNERDEIARVGTKAAAIDAAAKRANELGNDYADLYRASADDLSNTLAALTADQVTMSGLFDDLLAEQSTVAADTVHAAERAAEFARQHAKR